MKTPTSFELGRCIYGFMVSNGTGNLKIVIIWVPGDDCLLVCLTLLKWCLWDRFIVHFVFWECNLIECFSWSIVSSHQCSQIWAVWKGFIIVSTGRAHVFPFLLGYFYLGTIVESQCTLSDLCVKKDLFLPHTMPWLCYIYLHLVDFFFGNVGKYGKRSFQRFLSRRFQVVAHWDQRIGCWRDRHGQRLSGMIASLKLTWRNLWK